MGHAFHFLERLPRVGEAFLQQALGLYYSTDRARAVINIAMGLPPPSTPEEGDERVALALDDSASPPYLIASRAGRMVTCLAAGMSPYGARVIDQPSVAQACAFYDDMRGRQQELSLKAGTDLFLPIRHGGWRMDRSTFRGLSFLWPWLQTEFVYESYRASTLLVKLGKAVARDVRRGLVQPTRTSAKTDDAPPRLTQTATTKLSDMMRGYWDGAWLCAHTMLLAFCDSPETFFETALRTSAEEKHIPVVYQDTIGWSMIRENFWALTVRGLWLIGQSGPFVLDALCEGAQKHRTVQGGIKNLYGMAVIGLRNPDLRPKIIPALERATALQPPKTHDELVCQQLARQALLMLNATPESLDIDRRAMVALGRTWFARCNPQASKPPDDDTALTFASFLPFDLADLRRKGSGLPKLHALLPWLAKASALSLYLPDDLAASLPEDSTPYAAQMLINHAIAATPLPQKSATPKPNRNDPCPCGSGKKYKRCCLDK